VHSFTRSFLSGLPKIEKGGETLAQIDLLIKIADAGEPVSAKDVGVTAARLRELEKDGLVQRPKKGETVRKTGGKGRPSHLYVLARKGSDRVRRARKATANERQVKAAKKAVEVVAASTPAA
jgi:predicted ArsR family transcriptional regulator